MPENGLAIRRVSLDALHLDPSNARVHGEENMAAIEGSLRRFGQAEAIVVQKASGRVIGGNGPCGSLVGGSAMSLSSRTTTSRRPHWCPTRQNPFP